MSSRRVALGLGGLLAIGLAALAFHLNGRAVAAHAPSDTAQAGVRVAVATAQARTLPLQWRAAALMQAYREVTVRSRVDGEVVEVLFQEGHEVAKGDVLARIDPRPIRAREREAQAQCELDRARLAHARAQWQRTRELVRDGFLSQSVLDQNASQLEGARASLNASEARLSAARLQMELSVIRAPMEGHTGPRLVDAGGVVRAADSAGIVRLVQVEPIYAAVSLPEHLLPELLRPGLTETDAVELLGPQDEVLERGRVEFLDSQVDPASGTVRLKARFANRQRRLWPGQGLRVRLTLGTRSGIAVPAEAVQAGADGLFVYAVDEQQRAQPRPVTVVLKDDRVALLSSGLRVGERVVTEGLQRIAPGVRVAFDGALAPISPAAQGSR